jgi:predicted acetyltransferase
MIYAPLDAPRETPALRAVIEQAFDFRQGLWERFHSLVGAGEFRVVRRKGTLVGGLARYPFEQWFGGRAQPSVGLAGVGVAPEARRTGAGSALLRGVLREAREEGTALSCLYASTSQLYQHVGFAECGSLVGFRLPLTALAGLKAERDLPLERLELSPDHAPPPAIARVYERVARASSGFLARSPLIWERVLRVWEDAPVWAYRVGSEADPRGYLVYTHSRAGSESGYELCVRDWAALDGAAARRLWTFCSDHTSLARAVRWKGPPVDPLASLLPEPTAPRITSSEAWLLRIVDVAAALERRGFPEWVQDTLDLEVEDRDLSDNAGRHRLRVEGGSATVERGGEGTLRLSINALAPLFTGWLTPSQLQATGRLQGTPAALAAATRMFSGPAPWMPDRF